MAEQGKDTTEIEGLIEQFNLKLEDAKQTYEKAQEQFHNSRRVRTEDQEQAKTYFEQGNKFMEQAKNSLNEAQKEMAKEAPILKEKPRINYQVLDKGGKPLEIKNSFWEKFLRFFAFHW